MERKTLKIFVLFLFLISSLTIFGATKKKLDGDTVWKQQCSRCHLAPGAISPNKMDVVLRHMRDISQLTDGEYRAVVGFVKGENHESKKNR